MNLPQPVAEVPLPDAPQAKAFIEACQECEIQLATAKKQATISTLQTNALKLDLGIGLSPTPFPLATARATLPMRSPVFGLRQRRDPTPAGAPPQEEPQSKRISTAPLIIQRFLLTLRPISYIMLTIK